MAAQTYEKYYGTNEIPADSVGFFRLPFRHEFQLKKLVVRQTAGGPCAFTVSVLNSAEAEGLSSDAQSTYRSMPARQEQAGKPMEFFSTEGHAFKNRDGSPALPQSYVYVQIAPVGNSGVTTWEITLAGVPGTPG